MPSYMVTLKKGSTDEEVTAAKELAQKQGGEITDEFTLIKGFAVSYPEGTVQTLENHPTVQSFEPNGTVKTQ
ncbi:hypothetical protein BROUX41_001307 [Berkeleyomyces rouxiae]|uniref:uncharacterized protein n=1 Tax=Berkeleyomyces rouxiae TaxID=2035830 RepID=UPI003B7F491C